MMMGLDNVLFEVLTNAAIGVATVLLVFVITGLRIPNRAPVIIRRNR